MRYCMSFVAVLILVSIRAELPANMVAGSQGRQATHQTENKNVKPILIKDVDPYFYRHFHPGRK